MDYFTLFSAYLLTFSELFGYVLSMKWGERKKQFKVENFWCICDNDMFEVRTCEVDYSNSREEYKVITCAKCGCKFKTGKTEDGKLIMLRQPVMSDRWEFDIRERVLN